jgi:ABC-2 type transport system ATP-binding protein
MKQIAWFNDQRRINVNTLSVTTRSFSNRKPMLQLRSLYKRYGSRPILDIADLNLETGLYWLQGANGSGKTSLLRILAGILPFYGDVLLRSPDQKAPVSLRQSPTRYRRLIAWADAEPQYPGFLTGLELLSFYRNILHPDTAQVQGLIEGFGMGGWLDTRTAAWSSGMTKKLSLLLAFLGQPALTLLDEPFITLDESGRDALNAFIADRQARSDASFIISSHQEIGQAMLPITHCLTLVQGHIVL